MGKEGEELAFLSWVDPDPLPLKVFSFSTWPGIEAKWYFDCPRDDNSTSNSKVMTFLVVLFLTEFSDNTKTYDISRKIKTQPFIPV